MICLHIRTEAKSIDFDLYNINICASLNRVRVVVSSPSWEYFLYKSQSMPVIIKDIFWLGNSWSAIMVYKHVIILTWHGIRYVKFHRNTPDFFLTHEQMLLQVTNVIHKRLIRVYLQITKKSSYHNSMIDSLIDWFIDWLIDWFIDWLINWLVDWLIYWLIGWLIYWLVFYVVSAVFQPKDRHQNVKIYHCM